LIKVPVAWFDDFKLTGSIINQRRRIVVD